MKNIPLNAKVRCTDGVAGRSSAYVLERGAAKMTHLVVRSTKDAKQEFMVPLEHISEVSAKEIQLDCNLSELAAMKPFAKTEFFEVQMPYYDGIQSNTQPMYLTETEVREKRVEQLTDAQMAIKQGAEVEATDGVAGRVQELIIDPETGSISHFVLREKKVWGSRDVIMPVSLVEKVVRGTVYLTLDQATIKMMLAIPEVQRAGEIDFELLTLALDNPEQAKEALKTIKKMAKGKDAVVLNAALLEKDETGQPALRELDDIDTKQGALFGAVAGGLVGLLGGPVGVVLGAAAGAAAGGAATRLVDLGFSDDYLAKLQEAMQPGSASLIILARTSGVDEVIQKLSPYGGQMLRQSLTEDLIDQIAKTEEDED